MHLPSGFFLDHAWLIPLIPAVSFWLILGFGKRFGARAAYCGIAALSAVWVLAVGAVIQWIHRVNVADDGKGGTVSALGAFGRSLARAEEGKSAAVAPVIHATTWFQNAGVKLTVGTQIDGLAVMMLFVVATIALLVHIYSFEYMRGDRRFTHYYAALSLFSASMLFLVVASNTLQLLVGWELVGLCSFMLIGHWWEEKPNSDAALKAFLTTRTGDIGLLCGVIMTFFVVQRATGTGSFDILAVNNAALSGKVGHTLLLMCAVGLMFGIIGKSGQFPLHTWLPDAMAGPTPVSALIHAATMVVAGVYLGARVYPIFWQGFQIGNSHVNFMAVIGGITVIIGAGLAFVQDDIKKVLAYSTISQLGYMVMGLGVGAWTAAIFHLFTHAFFKANLFLGAGSVSHSGSHHSFDMKKDMGGLRKYMPQTFWTFVIGTGALAGIFPLAGFWSKDEILATAGHGNYKAFLIVGLVGAFMTAAYMTRCIYLTFFGEYRGGHSGEHAHGDVAHGVDDAHVHGVDDAHAVPGFGSHDDGHGAHEPHESPPLITVPLWILTFLSITAGWLQFEPGLHLTKFRDWFQPRVAFPLPGLFSANHVATIPDVKFSAGLATISVAIALAGVGLAYLFYWKRAYGQDAAAHNALLGAGKKFLVNKYYLDALYTDGVIAAVKGPIANAAYWVNQYVIDNVLRTTGRVATVVARFVYRYIDQRGVDGIYNGTAVVTGESGGLLRKLQNGRLQEYALFILIGVAAVALALAIRF